MDGPWPYHLTYTCRVCRRSSVFEVEAVIVPNIIHRECEECGTERTHVQGRYYATHGVGFGGED